MAHRAATLETKSSEALVKLEKTEKQLSDSRLLVQQVSVMVLHRKRLCFINSVINLIESHDDKVYIILLQNKS